MKWLKYLCVFIISGFVLTGCSPQTDNEKENPTRQEVTDTAQTDDNVSDENKIEESTLKAFLEENDKCMRKIFAMSSLPHIDEEVEPNIYIVDKTYFKSYEDFESYVRSVYCKETADRLLYDYPYEGNPKYINIDGELCVNTALDGSKGYYVDWTDCKVAIKDSDGKQCTFSVTGQKKEPADNPTKEDYTVESKAVFENGKWLLGEMIY